MIKFNPNFEAVSMNTSVIQVCSQHFLHFTVSLNHMILLVN